MKFAKQLALRTIPTWSDYYIDYRTLKKYLKENAANLVANENDPLFLKSIVEEFRGMLVLELQKVDGRYERVEKESRKALEELDGKWYEGMPDEEYESWRKNILKLLQSLESLKEFTQTNITGFQKILKKFDKYFYNTSSTEELEQLTTTITISDASRETLKPNSGSGMLLLPEPLKSSFKVVSPPSRTSTASPSNNLNRYTFTPIGKELWSLVTSYKFVTSESDENLLSRARQIWRKRVPLSPGLSPTTQNLTQVLTEDISLRTVQALDLEGLPHGQVSYLWVELAEDGMNLPIKVPVIVAKGVKPGPVVGLTAALHGNELNGIPLIHRLISQELNPGNLHGIVVACPVANVPGYLAGRRTFSDGTDLNRVMPGKPNGTESQTYAFNLIDRIVSKFTHLLDLHTASKGRANSLYVRANMKDNRTNRMARLQNPQIIVHNTSPDGSLRGAAMERGILAITVEIGDPSTFQKRFVRNALQGVTNILSNLKMIPQENLLPEHDPVICTKSHITLGKYWIFCNRGGILNVLPDVNTWIRKSEPIATLHSVFGHLVETYYAPEDGIVIGKEMDPVCQSGQRILHLGVVMGNFEEKVDDGHL
ncbi:hypothetical protein G9A89_008377 [Geosiphon pyriformis]|nr:hypothetical protein G9A89_008377 [Geosiphon pyriformis]